MNETLIAHEVRPLDSLRVEETRVAVREGVAADVVEVEDEALPALSTSTPDMTPFVGAGALPFPKAVQDVLRKYHNVPDDWIDIRPEGHIYLTYSRLQDIFDEAFGFGGWSMVPVGDEFKVERQQKTDRNNKPYEHVILYREYRLYALGRFQRQAMGAGDYRTNNPAMNLSDAAEMCESYAMNRMGKRFRIAAQCWDKAYSEQWKSKYATNTADGWKKRGSTAATPPPQQTAQQHEPIPETERPTEVNTDGDSEEFVRPIVPSSLSRGAKATFLLDASGQKYSVWGKANIDKTQAAISKGQSIRATIKRSGKYMNINAVEVI